MDMHTEVRGHPTQAEKFDDSRGFVCREQEQRQAYQTLRAVATTCKSMAERTWPFLMDLVQDLRLRVWTTEGKEAGVGTYPKGLSTCFSHSSLEAQ